MPDKWLSILGGKTVLFAVLILPVIMVSSCNLPENAVTEVPACDPNSPPDLPSPVDGTIMPWFDNSELVFVEDGEFPMGVIQNPSDLSADTDNPQHTVWMDAYWIYRYPVTNAMYRLCVNTGVCTPPEAGLSQVDYKDPTLKDHPVVGVDWTQAQKYCNWMDGRLPTEAEWEKAARGPEGNLLPWGNTQPTCDLLNMADCLFETSSVVKYPKGVSRYDIFDLAGNTFEWVGDWYQADYYDNSPSQNPPGPENGQVRVVRSSSFKIAEDSISNAKRFYFEPEKARDDLSFRCVVEEPGACDSFGFAPYCQLSAFIPAGPGQSGDDVPPGGPPEGPPPGEPPACLPPEPSLDSPYKFCSDQGTQWGGANVRIDGEVDLPEGCHEEGPVVVCSGPSGSTIDIEVCTSCEAPEPQGQRFDPVCAPGYLVSFDPDTGETICKFAADFPGAAGGECPHGFFREANADVCVQRHVEPSQKCPEGYQLDPSLGCCSATFASPALGSEGGILGNVYPGCPPGWSSAIRPDANGIPVPICVQFPDGGGGVIRSCQTFTVSLGTCSTPGGGGGPGGGGCPPGSCGVTEFWCAATCSCKVVGDPC